MSSIGIMTFLHNGNYGSSLQAYALQRVIREMGFDCEDIDYRPNTREKVLNMLLCGNSPRLLTESVRKKQVQTAQAGLRDKQQAIDRFYAERMQLSEPCRNRKELARLSERYDILLCGSDQIWNPVWMNPAYFLHFGSPGKSRIAYAPSLGITGTPGKRKSRMIRQMTSLFDAVSVREEEGARLLVTLTGIRPAVLPDPVCLLTRAEWTEIASPAPEGKPYFLCYFIGENRAYWQKVRAIRDETGLRPLVIPVTGEGYGTEGEFDLLDGAGPAEFLGAVSGAEMICTDSFHGLVFGTLFEKRVDLIRRYREDDPESKNSRVDHFVRAVRDKGLEAMRQEGLAWLKEQLCQLDPLLSGRGNEEKETAGDQPGEGSDPVPSNKAASVGGA